jgi:ankyrin repeat protein
MFAAENGHVEVMRILLRYGAHINALSRVSFYGQDVLTDNLRIF